MKKDAKVKELSKDTKASAFGRKNSNNQFTFRWITFLILGGIAWWVNDWVLESQSFFIVVLQLICLVMIIVSDLSRFAGGHLKSRPDDASRINLLEVASFQLFLAIYSVLIAIVVILNIPTDVTGFLMSPLGLWLASMPIMIAAFLISRLHASNYPGVSQ